MVEFKALDQPCGVRAEGVDLSKPLSAEQVGALRRHWLAHKVLIVPNQKLTEQQLGQFSLAFGEFGDDPYFAPIDTHPHIAEIRREPDETTPLFAEAWHSDWSFLPVPPAGTCLHARIIPPSGGDTLFTNNAVAYEALDAAMKQRLDGLMAIHSPAFAYSKGGYYDDADKGRSMRIRPNDSAKRQHSHPLVRVHPETGEKVLFISPGYTIGIEGMEAAAAFELLNQLYEHMTDDRFVYRHKWEDDMLIMWDNRAVNHMATGGYQGHRRVLYRTTIADKAA